jgi:hypothetical protein
VSGSPSREFDVEGVDMPRIDLRVPITQKDEAKSLGARWDANRKLWYVPDGVAAAPLTRWMPVRQAPNVCADRYLLLVTTRDCWRCEAKTQVFGIALPEGYEALQFQYENDEDDDDAAEPVEYWRAGPQLTVLSYVKDVTDAVARRLQILAPRYRIDLSQTTRSFYWMNHCEHCDAKLGDHETFHEFGVGFDMSGVGPNEIQVQEVILEPFSAACSYSEKEEQEEEDEEEE